jgi:hypothetical protein
MSEDAQHRATEFLKELYAAGHIDEGRFDAGVAELLTATSDAEVAEVVRALPAPVALTSPDRRLDRPLEIHSGMRRLRLTGRWQVARETHVSADLGSVRIGPHRGRVRRPRHRSARLHGVGKHHDHRAPGGRGPGDTPPGRGGLAT